MALSETQRVSIESVCMDMWRAYISSKQKHVPSVGEKLAINKLHVAQHVSDAVNKMRWCEHKACLD